MPQLRVDLQDGFAGELTILKIDGKEVHRSNPKTRTQIGLAEACSFELPAGSRRVTFAIEIPKKGVSGSHGFVPSADLSLGVSVEPTGVISFRTSIEPFGYV